MMTHALNRRSVLRAGVAMAAVRCAGTAGAQPPQEGFFLLSNPATDSLTFHKDTTAEQIPIAASPWGVAVGPEGQGYLASAQAMTIVDGSSLLPVREVPYRTLIEAVGYGEYRTGGMGIAITPDGGTVAVGIHMNGSSGHVELFDVERGEFYATVPVGVRPFDVVASPDSKTIYSIDHDSFTITAIDLETLTPATIDAAPLGYGEFDKPHYAAVRSDGTLLLPYVGQLLWMIDPAAGATSSLPMTSNTHQHGITLSADETVAYIVGTGPAGPATGAPNLTILDLETGDERIIELTRPHEQVALTGDERTAILTGGYTFADGGWDGVTHIDLETDEISELIVPGRPLGIRRLN